MRNRVRETVQAFSIDDIHRFAINAMPAGLEAIASSQMPLTDIPKFYEIVKVVKDERRARLNDQRSDVQIKETLERSSGQGDISEQMLDDARFMVAENLAYTVAFNEHLFGPNDLGVTPTATYNLVTHENKVIDNIEKVATVLALAPILFGQKTQPIYEEITGRLNRHRGVFGFAAAFDGDVRLNGRIIIPGGGFRIDHPLEPARKSISHSFVESPDMKNAYDGVVALDEHGECRVELPEWFEAINCDFRYQLSSICEPAPNLHVAREISNNSFNIAGSKSGLKVSWQVTGIRKDAWAQAHPVTVDEEKPENERGYYHNPELYDQPRENSTLWKGNSELIPRLRNGETYLTPRPSSSQHLEGITFLVL